MATQPKVWVWGRSLAGIVGLNPANVTKVCVLLSVVCCHVEVSVMSRSFNQRSPNEFIRVTEYDEVHQ